MTKTLAELLPDALLDEAVSRTTTAAPSLTAPDGVEQLGMPLRTAITHVAPGPSDALHISATAHGWLAGTPYQARVVGQLWLDAIDKGFDAEYPALKDYLIDRGLYGWAKDPFTCVEALATWCSESQLYEEAENVNYDASGKETSRDRGITQANSLYEPDAYKDAFNAPLAIWWAVRYAASQDSLGKGSFKRWIGNASGVWLYDAYRRRAVVGIANMLNVVFHDRLLELPHQTVYMRQILDPRKVRVAPDGHAGYVDGH